MPFCSSMAALTATFGFVALSWNIINTAGNTYVLWIAAEAARAARGSSGSNDPTTTSSSSSFLINTVNAAFGAGSLAAPVVAELCASKLAQPLAAYWVTAALTGLSAASFLLLPSPKPPAAAAAAAGSSSGSNGLTTDGADSSSTLQQPLLAAADADSTAAAADGSADGAAVAAAIAAAGQPVKGWSGSLLLLLGVTALFNMLNVGTEGE